MRVRSSSSFRAARRRLASAALVIALAGALAGESRAATPQCFGLDATIIGTSGSDTIDGTPGDDVIVARGGDDVITARSGWDRICAGRGDDKILGGNGADLSAGGAGDDAIKSGRFGRGGDADDRLFGGSGDDRLIGHRFGSEQFFPGPGRDHINGRGPGDRDAVFYESARRRVRVDLTRHTAHGQGRDAVLGIEAVYGSRLGDVLIGDSTTDGSRAGSVDNILVGMGGPDRLAGRGGIDSLDGGGGRDSLSAGRGGKPFFNEVLTGGAGRDRLFGGLGVDAVLGGTSNDVLHGGAASDRLSGDEGDDYLDGDAGRDFLDGGPGTDECLSGRRRQCE